MMEPRCYTKKSDKKECRIITPVGVCIAHIPDPNKPHPQVHQFNALWDTGAAVTAITPKVAQALGLIPITYETVFHAQGQGRAPVYKANVLLPNGIEFHNLRILEGNLYGFDLLIGMDIISEGDFALTNRDGKTVFSFQIPSTHLYDFEKQQEAQQANAASKKKKKKK